MTKASNIGIIITMIDANAKPTKIIRVTTRRTVSPTSTDRPIGTARRNERAQRKCIGRLVQTREKTTSTIGKKEAVKAENPLSPRHADGGRTSSWTRWSRIPHQGVRKMHSAPMTPMPSTSLPYSVLRGKALNRAETAERPVFQRTPLFPAYKRAACSISDDRRNTSSSSGSPAGEEKAQLFDISSISSYQSTTPM